MSSPEPRRERRPAGAGRSVGQLSRIAARRPQTVGVAIVCALAAVYLAQSLHDARLLSKANRLGSAGHYVDAARLAARVDTPPADARALLTRAYALQGQRKLRPASDAFAAASARDPNNWLIYRDWAVVLADLGRRKSAGRVMEQALALNPRLELPEGFARPAPRSRRSASTPG